MSMTAGPNLRPVQMKGVDNSIKLTTMIPTIRKLLLYAHSDQIQVLLLLQQVDRIQYLCRLLVLILSCCVDKSNFAGYNIPRPPNIKTSNVENKEQSGSGIASFIGKTYTANENGQIRMTGPQYYHNVNSVPVPTDLKCTSMGSTVAEIEWNIPPPIKLVGNSNPMSQVLSYSTQLSWRNRNDGAQGWETAKTLIKGHICRKKNLMAGACYDFRVRLVEELPGGMLGIHNILLDRFSQLI
jgi:hypothetical protein